MIVVECYVENDECDVIGKGKKNKEMNEKCEGVEMNVKKEDTMDHQEITV